MTRLLRTIIIIIVLIILFYAYLVYSNSYQLADYVNGYWYADPGFCQDAEATSITFIFNKKVAQIAVIVGDEIIDPTVTKYSTSWVYNPVDSTYNSTISFRKKPAIFPKTLDAKLSVNKGNLILYRDRKVYANLYKNHVVSETIKWMNTKKL